MVWFMNYTPIADILRKLLLGKFTTASILMVFNFYDYLFLYSQFLNDILPRKQTISFGF